MDPEFKTITEADLHAYADGQLPPERQVLVARYLEANPGQAAEIAAWQHQNRAIETMFAPIGVEAVPARLSAHRMAETMARQRRSQWTQIAALGLVLALGLAGGWGLRTTTLPAPDSPTGLMQTAIEAHRLFVPQPIHPVEVAAAETGHLTTWLSNTLDRRLVMPDLSGLGYALVGGRILPTSAGPAAQIMYQTATGTRITLLLTSKRADQPLAERYDLKDGISALYWANEAVTCTVVGELGEQEMQTIVRAVLAELGGIKPARAS